MVVSLAGFWLSLYLISTDGETVAGLWMSLLLNSSVDETVAGLWLSLLLDCGCLCCRIVVVSVAQLD